jgi:hypothetical protein
MVVLAHTMIELNCGIVNHEEFQYLFVNVFDVLSNEK